MGRWLLRLSAKILALLRLSVNSFQLRLTKKLKITLFCFKELNIKKPVFFVSLGKIEPRFQGSLLSALRSEREREKFNEQGFYLQKINSLVYNSRSYIFSDCCHRLNRRQH